MALRGSADVAALLVDGYNILGTVTQITDKQMGKTERTDGLGDAWEEHTFTGVREAEITQEGFYDDAANSAHAALSSGPGNSSRILVYCPEGTATGQNFKGMRAVQVDYDVQAERGMLHKAKAIYKANGRFDQGVILYTHKPTAGTSAEVGNVVSATNPTHPTTVSSTGGGVGLLQLSAFTSAALATGVRARVQHSSDDVTYADLITFTVATAAPFAERVETTAVVESHLRMATSYQGGASAQATLFVGFARR